MFLAALKRERAWSPAALREERALHAVKFLAGKFYVDKSIFSNLQKTNFTPFINITILV